MALPLKSGADLYNNQALRLRLHNLGADPTEVGAGLIYFNTSSGMNTSQKARLYTGSAWKTIAFSEDLDVASNADFLALKERVDLLSGDVDTDNLINNLKDLEEFLKDFDETDKLKSLLDGKLDKTGGTITKTDGITPLTLESTLYDTTDLVFRGKSGALGGIFINGVNGSLYVHNSNWSTQYKVLDENNYSDYALPLTGGTIEGSKAELLNINSTTTWVGMNFSVNGSRKVQMGWGASDGAFIYNFASSKLIGVKDDGTPHYSGNTLLHSGNIGEYKAGDSNKLGGISASSYMAAKTISGDLNATDLYSSQSFVLSLNSSAQNVPSGMNSGEGIYIAGYDTGFMLLSSYSQDKLMYRRGSNSLGSNSILSNDWKTIAFTDSNVASAQALTHSNGTVGATVASSGKVDFSANISMALNKSILDPSGRSVFMIDGNNSPQIGLDTCGSYSTYINGKDVYLRYGSSRTTGLILNSSGNVTIGASDLAQEYYKLAVGGSTYLLASKGTSEQPSLGNIGTGTHVLIGTDSYGLELWSRSNGNFGMQVHRFDGTATAYNLNLQPLGGNVLIGTTTDKGEKLQVAGSFRCQNNIAGDIVAHSIMNLNSDPYGLITRIYSNGSVSLQVQRESDNSEVFPLILQHLGGNVLIGKTTDNGKGKLQVEGDLYVTGNIIADGEVSAGGRAEEGGNAGGGGAFHSESIAVGATQTTIAHGLGTDDIVVSIYEKDGVSGRWSIILTDVEIVDANNIIVSFGSATNVEHKVVIMGAVA